MTDSIPSHTVYMYRQCKCIATTDILGHAWWEQVCHKTSTDYLHSQLVQFTTLLTSCYACVVGNGNQTLIEICKQS